MSNTLKTLLITLGFSLALPVMADDMGGMVHKEGGMGMQGQTTAIKIAHGSGIVEGVDATKGTVTLSHQPIKELNWPAMTMSFKVSKPELLKGIVTGQQVHFTLQNNNMGPVITALGVSK